jgi:L-methionine (R)-S-oxide reductase
MAEAFNDKTLTADKAAALRRGGRRDRLGAGRRDQPDRAHGDGGLDAGQQLRPLFLDRLLRGRSAKARELVVGPYQGTLGCLRIAFGRGVCGAAAETGQTQLVEDVHAFPGHIACDSRSESEIVVPVFDASGKLLAVFDVDSDKPAAFDAVDQHGLEAILKATFA